jgi:mannose-1-phosphate guanylyltransferase/mannose-6-phosphate isomerase
MYSIILCGGSGTRLWPLSRKNFPKQFLKLYSDKSLLQETFERMRKVMEAGNIYLVTNGENYFNVFNQIKEIYPEIKKEQIITEPASLNTAPAISLAVKYLTVRIGVDENDPLIFLPADHYIGKPEKFAETVKLALENVGDNIGTVGISPTGPETGFGYIKKGELKGVFNIVEQFKEKPDRQTAQEYLESGQYVWNGGMYLFNAKTFATELKKHSAKLSAHFEKSYDEFMKDFAQLESEPIDTAISEKSDKVIVFEGDFDWSDIGSFDVLSEIAAKNDRVSTKHEFVDSKNVYAHSESGKMIAVLGVDDIIVVESNDVVFVQKRGRSEDVKKVVNYLKENKRKEIEHNIIVYRPWGKYEVLIDNAANHKVKKITVFPGSSLSLQSHEHRAEHWVVVKGTAKVVNGENLLTLHENQSTYIPAKCKHQLSNPSAESLEIIEVQSGDYLEEDDIIRYKDEYGRPTGTDMETI